MAFAQSVLKANHVLMKCPSCASERFQKNGHRGRKQNYRCKSCGRQYVEDYIAKGYSEDTKQICVKMYRAGLKLREIERLTGISHGTIHNWVRQSGLLPSGNTTSEHET